MNSLSLLTLNNAFVAGIAVVATLTVEHGWKWVVAKAKAYAEKAKAEAESVLDVTAIKADIEKIKKHLNIQ